MIIGSMIGLSLYLKFSWEFKMGLFKSLEFLEFTIDLGGSIKFLIVGPIYKRFLIVIALHYLCIIKIREFLIYVIKSSL